MGTIHGHSTEEGGTGRNSRFHKNKRRIGKSYQLAFLKSKSYGLQLNVK